MKKNRTKRAPCKDCGKDTEPMMKNGEPRFARWDLYLVRDAIWASAGMPGWKSGFLCTPCLSKRLGRDLVDADYLTRPAGATKQGLEVRVVSTDYFDHHSVKEVSSPEEREKSKAEFRESCEAEFEKT